MILSDRVHDIFMNVSLCEKGCKYISYNIEQMKANCECQLKDKISNEFDEGNFALPIKTAFLDSNFGIIKCYNLVFTFKDKLENIGFWIFLSIFFSISAEIIFAFAIKTF